jgi:hypothetical protein
MQLNPAAETIDVSHILLFTAVKETNKVAVEIHKIKNSEENRFLKHKAIKTQ